MTTEPHYSRAPANAVTPARGPARIGPGFPPGRSASSSVPKPLKLPAWGWLHARPPSVADVLEHTLAGDWAPGERHPWLERAGRAYGFVIALPSVLVLGRVAWLLAKPTRVLAAGAVATLLLAFWWLNP